MLPVRAELNATRNVSFSPRTKAELSTVRYDWGKADMLNKSKNIRRAFGMKFKFEVVTFKKRSKVHLNASIHDLSSFTENYQGLKGEKFLIVTRIKRKKL